MKTAAELGLTQPELDALVRVRGRLSEGKIAFALDTSTGSGARFNMTFSFIAQECGTIGCIAGWVGYDLAGGERYEANRRTDRLLDNSDGGLWSLFYPDVEYSRWGSIVPADAVRAIDNFLSTGEPDWAGVLAEAT